MYTFTDDCLTGNEQIDKEHRYLFQLINTGFETLREEESQWKDKFQKLLQELKDYTVYHFSREESYMESINDPELPLQKQQHKAFCKTIEEMTSNCQGTKEEFNQMMLFLVKWLYQHILTSDIMIGKIETKKEKESEQLEFTSKFYTHVDIIDEEHRKLFAIINDVKNVIAKQTLHDKFDEIIRILNELKDYTEVHFSDEEKLMEKINYPMLDVQKRTHAAFIEKLVGIDLEEMDFIDDNQEEYLNSLILFLQEWLINHILKMDVLIGQYVKENNIKIE